MRRIVHWVIGGVAHSQVRSGDSMKIETLGGRWSASPIPRHLLSQGVLRHNLPYSTQCECARDSMDMGNGRVLKA